MRIGLLELAVLVWLGVLVARRLRAGGERTFDVAWIGLSVGVALLFTRTWFTLGALLTGGSFAVITLPMARAEWERRSGTRSAGTR